jgi:hypothetical protein
VDGIQVHKVVTVSRSKSDNVWIYSTVCTLATLGAHSPVPALPRFVTCRRHECRSGMSESQASEAHVLRWCRGYAYTFFRRRMSALVGCCRTLHSQQLFQHWHYHLPRVRIDCCTSAALRNVAEHARRVVEVELTRRVQLLVHCRGQRRGSLESRESERGVGSAE